MPAVSQLLPPVVLLSTAWFLARITCSVAPSSFPVPQGTCRWEPRLALAPVPRVARPHGLPRGHHRPPASPAAPTSGLVWFVGASLSSAWLLTFGGGGVKASDLRPPVLGGACPGPSCSAAVVKMALHVVLGVSARPRQPPGPAARPSNPCRASVSPSRGRSQAFHAASLSTLWPWPQRPPCPPLRQGSRLGAV